MVPPTGFEPVISTLKGWRPWPLDDGDSALEYSKAGPPFTTEARLSYVDTESRYLSTGHQRAFASISSSITAFATACEGTVLLSKAACIAFWYDPSSAASTASFS